MDKKQDDGPEQSAELENSGQVVLDKVAQSPQLLERILDTPTAKFLIAQQRSHSGPLPAPEDLEQYNSIIENGAERIMQMAEKEQSFRHERIKTDNDAANSIMKRGQIFGLLSVLGVLALSAYLAHIGHPTGAAAVASVVIAAVAGVFVSGRRSSDKNENELDPEA